MTGRLLPKHYAFATLFIKVRWFAAVILLVSSYLVKHVLNVSIHGFEIYILSVLLAVFNFIFLLHINDISDDDSNALLRKIKYNIHAQVAADFIILTLILHYSGGIENPLIIYYIFHMIIVSTIMSPKESYFQTGFALLLVGILAFLECFGIIPHYSLDGFVTHDLYRNHFYLFGTGFIFITTSFLVVSLVNNLVVRSRKIEDAYLKANIELEQQDKLKNEYVLRLTHDIKGHLAAIISSLYVVKSKTTGQLSEKQEEFIDIAYDRTNLLTDFIKDLLNLTRKRMVKDAGFERFSISELVVKIVRTVNVNAKQKGIRLNVEMDAAINYIDGNSDSLEEVFTNLLLNAIKYTPENGQVKLTGYNRFDNCIFEISDNGIGIPEAEVTRVFDEFFRASNVKKDKRTGTGLGLSIVKQIVEDHRGRIWVESKLGAGTKFTFSLPKNQPVSASPE
jgi:signal transduction histidine kinase